MVCGVHLVVECLGYVDGRFLSGAGRNIGASEIKYTFGSTYVAVSVNAKVEGGVTGMGGTGFCSRLYITAHSKVGPRVSS